MPPPGNRSSLRRNWSQASKERIESVLKSSTFLIFQTVSQSSIFPTSSANSRSRNGENQEQRNSNLSVPTSVSAFGYKLLSSSFFWETGIVQDYNNFGNETDFVFFWEICTAIRWLATSGQITAMNRWSRQGSERSTNRGLASTNTKA